MPVNQPGQGRTRCRVCPGAGDRRYGFKEGGTLLRKEVLRIGWADTPKGVHCTGLPKAANAGGAGLALGPQQT